jgi:DnaK suppressor protein
MTKKELNAIEQKLQGLADRLSDQIWQMREEALRTTGNADDEGLPAEQLESASHEAEEERTLNLLETQQDVLREVEAAQARIVNGTFGKCTECGSAIAKHRLAAVPYACSCFACAAKQENQVGAIA